MNNHEIQAAIEHYAGVRNIAMGLDSDLSASLRLSLLELSGRFLELPILIESRIKSLQAIGRKLGKNLVSWDERRQCIDDLVGIRVILRCSAELNEAAVVLSHWSENVGLIELKRRDMFEATDTVGYRALHINYAFIQRASVVVPEDLTAQLQVTTYLQNVHSAMSHRLVYKSELGRSLPVESELDMLSNNLSLLDEKLSILFQNLEPNEYSESPDTRISDNCRKVIGVI